MMVDGHHRVAIYARDDIQAGQELLYDYGYEKELGEHAPQWAQKS